MYVLKVTFWYSLPKHLLCGWTKAYNVKVDLLPLISPQSWIALYRSITIVP